jgi:4-alpha-glucanotransferase
MLFKRESGILSHITSLPGHYGMGEIGRETLRWIHRLYKMEQRIWQILPLGPTGFGDSPYQCLSSFAGNPLIISLEDLWYDGLISRTVLADFPQTNERKIDFGRIVPLRKKILYQAAENFLKNTSGSLHDDFNAFCLLHKSWLDDFAMFIAIKEAHNEVAWVNWPKDLRDREKSALKKAAVSYKQKIAMVKVLQFLFERQWKDVKRGASELGIRIIGDVPIFVAHDSADVWANPHLFDLDKNGNPRVIAGVPPDYFSKTGQRWGNPHYLWKVHKEEKFAWWLSRIKRMLDWVDIIRIDHFRGFCAYWEIPGKAKTAIKGRWVKAPGRDLFKAMNNEFGALPLIAEDLGLITKDVEKLRDEFHLPGLRILQFAFGTDDQKNSFLPKNYINNCVAYTGTHDNDTTVGWFTRRPGEGSTDTAEDIEKERKRALKILNCYGDEIHWDFMKALLHSNAGATIVPLQDILGLGSDARMNTPSTIGSNWNWRFTWNDLTPDVMNRFASLTKRSKRGSASPRIGAKRIAK